jgi:hypothetical protein
MQYIPIHELPLRPFREIGGFPGITHTVIADHPLTADPFWRTFVELCARDSWIAHAGPLESEALLTH